MDNNNTCCGVNFIQVSVLVLVLSVVGALLYMGCLANGTTDRSALFLAIPGSLLAATWFHRRVMAGNLLQAAPRGLFAVWILLSLFAVYQVSRLTTYMFDVEKVEYAFSPKIRSLSDEQMRKPFFVKHNCFTSYVIAAHLAAHGAENLYLSDQYRNPAEGTEFHRAIGDRLTVDRYQYPPPFLLLPRLLLAITNDFFQMRGYWFALNVLVFSATVVALGIWMAGREFGLHWFAWPLVLLAPTTLGTFQIGNVHLLIICLSVGAMLALEQRRDRLGGALLGFVVVSKIFPGLLVLYLLARRRWSAVAWTGVAMVVYGVVTLLVFGPQPFKAFFTYQLPRLASGEAFSFAIEYIRPLTLNLSAVGIPFKLDKLGWLIGADPKRMAYWTAWGYTSLLVAVAVVMGLRHRGTDHAGDPSPEHGRLRLALLRSWLALLILAQMRSPFLPWGYGSVAIIWLLALCLPMEGRRWPKLIGVGLCLFVFALNVPLPFGPETHAFDLCYTLAAFVIALVLSLIIATRSIPLTPADECATGRPG